MGEDLILATMPNIPKYEVEEVFGVVYGSSTRTRGMGGRFVSGLQAITGGKGTAYAKEIEKARKEAIEDLKGRGLVYEKDGAFVKTGNILAAEYILDGKIHRAFLYTDPDGRRDYYDENGYSMRKTLLKSPLNYRRVSSKFSYRRLHPIRKIYRPHLGVDYAADGD